MFSLFTSILLTVNNGNKSTLITAMKAKLTMTIIKYLLKACSIHKQKLPELSILFTNNKCIIQYVSKYLNL